METNIILLLILAASVLGKANSVAVATCMLLIFRLISLDKYLFPFIENHGVFIGLVLLIAAILVPLANGQISAVNLKNIFTS